MKTAEKICALLAEKKAAFQEYEEITRRILHCPIDDIEQQMKSRAEIIGQVNALDSQIADEAAGFPALLAAAHNASDRGGLSADESLVYDAGTELFAVMCRVRRLEELAIARVKDERDELEEKIRKNNTSMQAHAARYFEGISTLGSPPEGGFGLGKA